MTESIRQRWRDGIRDSKDPAIDGLTIAVAMALDRYMTADGTTKSGVRTLARLARVTHGTITDRTARLEAAGWLHINRASRGNATTYRATLPDDRPAPPDTHRPAPPDTSPSRPTGHSDPSSNGRSVRPHASEVSGGTEKSVRPHRTDPEGIPKGSRREGTSASGRTAPSGATASGSRPPGAGAAAEPPQPSLTDLLFELARTDPERDWAWEILDAVDDTGNDMFINTTVPGMIKRENPSTLNGVCTVINEQAKRLDIDIRLPKGPK